MLWYHEDYRITYECCDIMRIIESRTNVVISLNHWMLTKHFYSNLFISFIYSKFIYSKIKFIQIFYQNWHLISQVDSQKRTAKLKLFAVGRNNDYETTMSRNNLSSVILICRRFFLLNNHTFLKLYWSILRYRIKSLIIFFIIISTGMFLSLCLLFFIPVK